MFAPSRLQCLLNINPKRSPRDKLSVLCFYLWRARSSERVMQAKALPLSGMPSPQGLHPICLELQYLSW